MEPIISPWWFYLAHVSENISRALLIISITLIIVVGMGIFTACVLEEGTTPIKENSKLIVKSSIVTFCMILIACILPPKNVVYQMIAANTITEQRVEQFIHAGKLVKDELKNDLIDVIKSIGEKPKTE